MRSKTREGIVLFAVYTFPLVLEIVFCVSIQMEEDYFEEKMEEELHRNTKRKSWKSHG